MDFSSLKLNGWKKDPKSSKDLPFAALVGRLGAAGLPHIIEEYTPISNQGGLSSCVGNSATDSLEILMGLQNPAGVVQLSRLMTYWIARLLTNDQHHDDGTFIRSAFSQLSRLGVCPETVWPYREDKVLVSPPIEAYSIGDANKVSSFYRIVSLDYERLDDIQKAVCADHPVVFGTGVGTDFLHYDGQGVLEIPTDIRGRHAIICTGVRMGLNGKREFLIRNSWGPGWGYQGHAWLSEEFMMWGETQDLWVPTLMPRLVL